MSSSTSGGSGILETQKQKGKNSRKKTQGKNSCWPLVKGGQTASLK